MFRRSTKSVCTARFNLTLGKPMIPQPGSSLARLSPQRKFLPPTVPADPAGTTANLAPKGWNPAVDISEADDCYHIRMDLAGLRSEDAVVQVMGRIITVRGQRHMPPSLANERLLRGERIYGFFARSFLLPADANIREVTFDYQAGVMSVVITKIIPHRVDIGTSELRCGWAG